ncbi:hypothetical protein QQ991_07330 [Weizmannia coagulans]|jgi:hypothetical protein|uniref:Uncharacterized protein n=3 Tax=Heyndrickxia TaxID=2837504 RepID=A0A0C5CA36_HEYCO|nr:MULTISPECIES: hypothetical protein [Heyndrickxia]NWN95003.1 hypothetical protein [Bacillus sp. (in: firmicutes)]AEO99534.1 hypothetical protein Bcoa_0311 [Heyndrickxia coagulans 36D1]AJO23701.1 hypothetical protein SB48_HM08orf04641 [Heyndrickxia coagulans]AKN54798.1 hypothetical protein AB434_2393 [Heyndrickxia coagulans]ATW83748.1 hypothetical protein CIW84_12525 [Heyndrickxia coagulans]
MDKNNKPYSDRRWTDPIGITEDGEISAISIGTKHYASEEERQRDIEEGKKIRKEFLKMLKERHKNNK